MSDAPPVKPWGQTDKELLQKLIDRRKGDISRTGDTDYIDKSATSTSASATIITFDATSKVTQEPMISKTS